RKPEEEKGVGLLRVFVSSWVHSIRRSAVLALLAVCLSAAVAAQNRAFALDPAVLGKPAIDAWPTYHVGYSGRRYRTLKKITRDHYFVSLDAATGRERWHREIASMKREYFSTTAPVIIGRHVIVGVGGDAIDIPGFLESRDPENGQVVWRWNSAPTPGDPDAK